MVQVRIQVNSKIGVSDLSFLRPYLMLRAQFSMDRRYKRKALSGVVAWFLSPVLALVPTLIAAGILNGEHSDMPVVIFFLTTLVAFYFTFFWGGGYLVKAKGYSNGILFLGILGPFIQVIILLVLLFGMEDRCPDPSRRPPAKRHRRDESLIARVVRLRRNAFAANVFGCVGIFFVVVTILLQIPVASTPDGNGLVRLLIFVPSYSLVIWGCANWIKAKNWPDAICLIGLLPLAVLLIPYVRLIYRLAPMAFPIGMAFMPIIMIAVIAVLPDKSGLPRRKHRKR
jgi:hypothetical protein